jgi:hypothetical protein
MLEPVVTYRVSECLTFRRLVASTSHARAWSTSSGARHPTSLTPPELLTGPRAALSPDDQYLLLIGLVALADALLEYRLRVLWVFETDTPGRGRTMNVQ